MRDAREGEGTDVVHPDRLRDEAQAPDRGRDEEKNGLAKLKERHDGSVLLGMLFFFRVNPPILSEPPTRAAGTDPAPETPARGRIRAPYPTVLRSVIPTSRACPERVGDACPPFRLRRRRRHDHVRRHQPLHRGRLEDRRGRSPTSPSPPRPSSSSRASTSSSWPPPPRCRTSRPTESSRTTSAPASTSSRTTGSEADASPHIRQNPPPQSGSGAVSQCLLTRRLPGRSRRVALFSFRRTVLLRPSS